MYTVKNGKLLWEWEGKTVEIEKPAFMWDAEQNLLLKHGDAKDVREYYDTYVQLMSKTLPDIMQTTKMLELKNVPVKAAAAFLNEAISTTGVIDRQLAKLKQQSEHSLE